MKIKTIIATIFLILLAQIAYTATYEEFIKDLKTIFFSTNGKANLFGYTQDFAFGEITEGSFSAGSFVVIKGKPDMASSIPPELYEDVAYGEVESIKGKYIKVFIIKRLKAIPQQSVIMGLNKLHLLITSNDDITPLLASLLKEKDFVILDKPDPKVLVKLSIQKIKQDNFGYKATLSPTERIISIGNISFDSTIQMPTSVETIKEPTQKPVIAFETIKTKPIVSTNTFITKHSKTGKIYVVDGLQIYCADCDNKGFTHTFPEKPVYVFEENGIIYIWDEKGKTTVLEGDTIKKIIGYKVPGFNGYFDPLTKKIFTDTLKTISMPEDAQYVYFYNNGLALIGNEKGLSLYKNSSLQKTLPLTSSILKIKPDTIALYTEEEEDVPLAGTYYKLFIKIYNLDGLNEVGSYELSENIKAFDIDITKKELLYLKKDGAIKKVGL